MKKKLYLGAIALVIAGLLLTSATGMSLSTQMSPAENKKITTNVDRQSIIDLYLTHPEQFKKAEYVQSGAMSPSKMTVESAQATTITKQSQQAAPVSLAPASVPEQTRHDYTIYNTYPGLADRLNQDHLLLCYESYFYNWSDSTQEEQLVAYRASSNYGANWTDPIGFVDDSQNFLNRHMPSICHWGLSGTFDRWYFTFQGDAVQENTGWINLAYFETDDTSIEDLLLATVNGSYWDYTPNGFTSFDNNQIACTDAYADYFWGVMTLQAKSGGIKKPGYFYQVNDTGWGSLATWSKTAANGDDCSIDMYDEAWTLLTWGTMWDPGLCVWMISYQDVPDFLNNSGYGWGDHGGRNWWYDNPSAATYKGQLHIAMEGWNHTIDPTGVNKYLELVRHSDYSPLDFLVGWEYWADDYTFIYPEIEPIGEDQFVCTVIGKNVSDATDVAVYILITTNGGYNWSDMMLLSGDDIVNPDLRCCEIAVGGNLAIWERLVDTGNPNDDVISLHLEYLTVELNGQVKYEEGLPVSPCEVYITNLDPDYGFTVQANTDGGNYWMKLFVGFDIWPDAEFELLGMDADDHSFEGIELYTFTDTSPFIITNDITVYQLAGDLNHDGCVTLSDLAALLGNYGTTSGATYEMGDIDGDGDVDLSDLAALLGNYGDCLP